MATWLCIIKGTQSCTNKYRSRWGFCWVNQLQSDSTDRSLLAVDS